MILALSLIYALFSFVYLLFDTVSVPDGIYPGFLDLNFLLKYVECFNNGFNPYIDKNSICIGELNYPLILLKLFIKLGLGPDHTYVIGFTFIVGFVISVSLLFKKLTIKQFILLLLIFISPPILFLLERGNIDILIFILILFSIFYIRKKHNVYRIYLSYLIILIASFLKIFPFFLLPLIFIEKIQIKHKIIIFTLFTSFFSLYIYSILDELKFIFEKTPKPSELAFGKNVLIQEFISEKYLPFFSIFPFVIGSFFFFLKRKWVYVIYERINFDYQNTLMFTSGVLIFFGIYFIGNNYDYRLVYFVLFLPTIFQLNSTDKNILFFKRFLLISIIIILSVSFLHRSVHIYQNYTQWFVCRNFLMSLKYLLMTIIVSFSSIYFYFIIIENLKEIKSFFNKN